MLQVFCDADACPQLRDAVASACKVEHTQYIYKCAVDDVRALQTMERELIDEPATAQGKKANGQYPECPITLECLPGVVVHVVPEDTAEASLPSVQWMTWSGVCHVCLICRQSNPR